MKVLGTKVWSYGRSESDLNHQGIAHTLIVTIFFKVFLQVLKTIGSTFICGSVLLYAYLSCGSGDLETISLYNGHRCV